MAKVYSPNGVEIQQLIVKKDNTGTYLYTGFADPGASDSAPVHAISRKTLATGALLWKEGGFTNTWTDRATGNYL